MTANADDQRETIDQPRGRHAREWEVFIRETVSDPLRHVGSVTADDREMAYEQADTLFEDVVAIWICPDTAVNRYTDPELVPGDQS